MRVPLSLTLLTAMLWTNLFTHTFIHLAKNRDRWASFQILHHRQNSYIIKKSVIHHWSLWLCLPFRNSLFLWSSLWLCLLFCTSLFPWSTFESCFNVKFNTLKTWFVSESWFHDMLLCYLCCSFLSFSFILNHVPLFCIVLYHFVLFGLTLYYLVSLCITL